MIISTTTVKPARMGKQTTPEKAQGNERGLLSAEHELSVKAINKEFTYEHKAFAVRQ